MSGKNSQYSSSLNQAGTLDVGQFEARSAARQRERVNRQLRDRLVGTGIRLVIQDVYGAVAHLQEIYVPSNCALGVAVPRRQLNVVLLIERGDVMFGEPNGHPRLRRSRYR